jgi:hypothetical protein
MTGSLVIVVLAGCGASHASALGSTTSTALANRYAVELLVKRDCVAAEQMEASRGVGCGIINSYVNSFGPGMLSFVRGSAQFHRRCPDVFTGGTTSRPCVLLTMVAHGSGTWGHALLQIYLTQHGGRAEVEDIAYVNGEGCFTPSSVCQDDRKLWAERVL